MLTNLRMELFQALDNTDNGVNDHCPLCVKICWRLVEACLDDLIEMIVRDGLNPDMMCEALFLCP